jgi:hypothetical protein
VILAEAIGARVEACAGVWAEAVIAKLMESRKDNNFLHYSLTISDL